MKKPKASTRRFVVDTNVFVAAIKPFTKKENPAARKRKPSGENTFTLLIRIITDDGIELIGNARLVSEYRKLAKELNSPTSALILEQLARKVEVTQVREEVIRRCKLYLPVKEAADVVHAATCLQTGAILITNDSDFDTIRDERLIEVWSIGRAIHQILS